MELYDFNSYPQSGRVYSGASGRKYGVIIDGENFLLKFPGNLKALNMKNVNLSYSNSPVSEFLGSHIYAELGIPVHETYLGMHSGKLVVACKDFRNKGDELQEFAAVKVTMYPPVPDSLGNLTNGTGDDLKEILLTIRSHPLLTELSSDIENRFWDMFVIDAYIGNADRNNGNWGIVRDLSEQARIAPVYDNGNSFN